MPQVSVNSFHSAIVTSVFGAYNEQDPLLLQERPPERLVEEADKVLRRKQGNLEPRAVAIANLGTFPRNGITILKKFCEISSLKAAIRSEEKWLEAEPDGLSVTEICAINDVLWNKSVA